MATFASSGLPLPVGGYKWWTSSGYVTCKPPPRPRVFQSFIPLPDGKRWSPSRRTFVKIPLQPPPKPLPVWIRLAQPKRRVCTVPFIRQRPRRDSGRAFNVEVVYPKPRWAVSGRPVTPVTHRAKASVNLRRALQRPFQMCTKIDWCTNKTVRWDADADNKVKEDVVEFRRVDPPAKLLVANAPLCSLKSVMKKLTI